MIIPIRLYDDPVLRETCTDVPLNTPLDVLISDMFETMHKGNGVGLAAPQLGILSKIFVVEAHIEEENFHMRGVFINPFISKEWGEMVKHPEGCLSLPFISGVVERPEKIEMEWYDEKWEKHKQVFSGYAARIIQHEYDHLYGKLYIDYLDTMWAKMLEKPLEQIKNREITTPYSSK